MPEIAGMLARAFAGDGLVTWPIGDVADVGAAARCTFEEFDLRLAEHGLVWEIGDAAAAAVWIGPNDFDALERVDAEARTLLRPITADNGVRMDSMFDWISSRIPAEPLWYLDHIGVDPSKQGLGMGRSLIEHGLARAHSDGVGAFLDTAIAGNVPFYERFGFRLVEEGDAPFGGPHIWFMRWDPPS